VKPLLDENLSRKLIARLPELYRGSAHVFDFDLLQQSDRVICEFAQREEFVSVSSDADFYELVTTSGPLQKVVWLRRWRHLTKDVRAGAPA
jgi:predicted nuclease of predicted toxin-antitoxin system